MYIHSRRRRKRGKTIALSLAFPGLPPPPFCLFSLFQLSFFFFVFPSMNCFLTRKLTRGGSSGCSSRQQTAEVAVELALYSYCIPLSSKPAEALFPRSTGQRQSKQQQTDRGRERRERERLSTHGVPK